jgi:hypothetical protein
MSYAAAIAVIATILLVTGFSIGQLLPFEFVRTHEHEPNRFYVQLGLTAVIFATSLYIILWGDYGATDRVAAIGSMVTTAGFWFGKKSS